MPSHVYLLLQTLALLSKKPSPLKTKTKPEGHHLQIPQANFDFSGKPKSNRITPLGLGNEVILVQMLG